jgi:DNA-binding NarL/FixJ family response regulator
MSEKKIRVLLVDDHLVVRLGLSTMLNLQQDMEVVAEAASGVEALEVFRRIRPDVTIMDLRIPGLNGFETTISIRQEFPDARIIVLSSYDGDENVYRALDAGAMAYLLKDMLSEELLGAIRTVHTGQRFIPPAVAKLLAERFPRPSLTPREGEVLNLIVKGKSNKEISYILNISESTVKMHVMSILSKLDASDRTQAATSAIQRGIVHLE